jgi:hypothetical protein
LRFTAALQVDLNESPTKHHREITMFAKKLLAIAGTLSCALTVGAANAETPVAFISGTTMYQWQASGIFGGSLAYQWEGYGFKVFGPTGPCVETNEALSSLQGIIASGAKPVIHLMVAGADAATDDTHTEIRAQTGLRFVVRREIRGRDSWSEIRGQTRDSWSDGNGTLRKWKAIPNRFVRLCPSAQQ